MIQETLLKGLRKIYRTIARPDFTGNPWPKDDEWETTNVLLTHLFSNDEPCFVGRIGTVECAVVVNYITVHENRSYLKKCFNYITDNTRLPFWDTDKPFSQLQNNAGFQMGKKAIHLGGGTQLLFGIKGKRWEGRYHGDDTRFADLFNEYWTYPSENEKPQNAEKVEGGCYWQ